MQLPVVDRAVNISTAVYPHQQPGRRAEQASRLHFLLENAEVQQAKCPAWVHTEVQLWAFRLWSETPYPLPSHTPCDGHECVAGWGWQGNGAGKIQLRRRQHSCWAPGGGWGCCHRLAGCQHGEGTGTRSSAPQHLDAEAKSWPRAMSSNWDQTSGQPRLGPRSLTVSSEHLPP